MASKITPAEALQYAADNGIEIHDNGVILYPWKLAVPRPMERALEACALAAAKAAA